MNGMEKIKNEEKFSNALPVSIKCGWRRNDAVYVLHDAPNAYIWAQNLLQKIPCQLGRVVLNTSWQRRSQLSGSKVWFWLVDLL